MNNELNKKQIVCNPNYYAVYGLLIGDALGCRLNLVIEKLFIEENSNIY